MLARFRTSYLARTFWGAERRAWAMWTRSCRRGVGQRGFNERPSISYRPRGHRRHYPVVVEFGALLALLAGAIHACTFVAPLKGIRSSAALWTAARRGAKDATSASRRLVLRLAEPEEEKKENTAISVTVSFDVRGKVLEGEKRKLREDIMKGITLRGMNVTSMDLDTGRLKVQLEAKQSKKKAPAKKITNSTPIEDIPVNTTLEGRVTVSNWNGVYFNIGRNKDAKLYVPSKERKVHRGFTIGEKFEDLRVERVTSERVFVVLPEERIAQLVKKAETPKSFEGVEIGSIVDGVIRDMNSKGVFVDIGSLRIARVNVPSRKKLSIGQELRNLRVKYISEDKTRATLDMEDLSAEAKESPPGGESLSEALLSGTM